MIATLGELADGLVELVDHEPREPRVQGAQEVRRRVRPVLVDPLVARGAGVAHVVAAQLPDDPVRRLHPPVHRRIDVWCLLQQLQALGELPFRGDLTAVPRQPLLASLAGQLVDPVGLPLGGVVLPQLDVCVWVVRELRQLVERRTVRGGGHHRARGEVGADPDDVGGVHPCLAKGGRDGGSQNLAVVLGHLQRPLRRQGDVVHGEHPVDNGMGILVGRGPELGPVADPDDDSATRQGPEVHTDHCCIVVLHRCSSPPAKGVTTWEAPSLRGSTTSSMSGAAVVHPYGHGRPLAVGPREVRDRP
jgi:hypothetical protein